LIREPPELGHCGVEFNVRLSRFGNATQAVVKAMPPPFRRERYRRRLTRGDMAELGGVTESPLAGFET
jgi:hypothetical protein